MSCLFSAGRKRCPALFTAVLLGQPSLAPAEEDLTTLPEMTVEGEAGDAPSLFQVDLEQAPVTTPDTASLLRRAPGANVNRNGPLTGIAQYRGMFADRVNVLVNGIRINTGGPNGMDPALSYVPRNQLDSLKVIRGIAPVSSGAETIGGTIVANARTSEFGTGEQATPSIDVTGGGATVNESGNLSALGAVANRDHRLHFFGSREKGSNIEYSDGKKIRPSRHERNNFGTGYGFRSGTHEFSLDIRRNETDPTGTPALPMDIVDINTSIVQGEYSGEVGAYAVHAQAFWTDVNHHMSNYELRDPPLMPMMGMLVPMTRLNDATSSGLGYRLDVSFPLASGTLMLGADGHQDEHDSTITDPVNNANFRIENFNDVERDVYGFFAEWNGAIATDWDLQLGGRYNRVNNDAGRVSDNRAAGSPGIAVLQDRFNAADRDKSDNNFDLVAKLMRPVATHTTLSFEAGYKTRSPSYQERYLWLPLQATNGLADGNVYVGDINLDPEKAWEVGLGLDWYGSRAYLEPRVFYRNVDDYIQGTPATDQAVLDVNPNALQFSNVDAKLYGADASWGVTLTDKWSLDGVVSYVRGERDDINDDLYRIAPLNGRASVTYRRNRWWASLEGVAYAKQNKVSETNNEEKTDSYQLLNLRAGIEIAGNLFINAGVENIFDSTARDHLTGINRVAESDVGLGERLPSPGRNFFATLQYRYN